MVGGFIGGIVGAIVLSIIATALYAIFAPQAFGDGQFVFVYFFTVPFGGLLGGAWGTAIEIAKQKPHFAGWLCVGAGGLVAAFLLFWISAQSNFLDRLTAPWCSVPLLGAIITLARGIWLLWNHRRG